MCVVENVDEINLRVEVVQLGGFNDGHSVREGFCAGICPREEPITASYSDRAQGALGRIVVDGGTPVSWEKLKASCRLGP